MYIEETDSVKAQILLTNYRYIEKVKLVEIIYKYTKFNFKFVFLPCHLSLCFK